MLARVASSVSVLDSVTPIERVFNLWVAEWVIMYNLKSNFGDVSNQTAEDLVLLLLGILVNMPVHCNGSVK